MHSNVSAVASSRCYININTLDFRGLQNRKFGDSINVADDLEK